MKLHWTNPFSSRLKNTRIATYEVNRETPRSEHNFLITNIIKAMTRLGYKTQYSKAMEEFARDEKILGSKGQQSVEISIAENRFRFFFRFPSEEFHEEDEWKPEREADLIVSTAFDTEPLRRIIVRAKHKNVWRKRAFKWIAMSIFSFSLLSSFFLCIPIVAEFLLRLSNPVLVEDTGRLILLRNVLPTLNVTIDISVWSLHLLVVMCLLSVYYLVAHYNDLGFARAFEEVEDSSKKVLFLRRSYVRERILRETGILAEGLQARGEIWGLSLACLAIAILPVYRAPTVILSVIFFWIGFFALASVTHVFDFDTSSTENFDVVRFVPKTSTLFYMMVTTFPGLVWLTYVFNSYIRSVTLDQVELGHVFYFSAYSGCIIAVIANFTIYLIVCTRVADPYESLASTIISLTIANFISVPSPPLPDVSNDPTELLSMCSFLMDSFNFVLLKVLPLLAIIIFSAKGSSELYARTEAKYRAEIQNPNTRSKPLQNIIVSFVKKKSIEIGLLLLALSILSLELPEISLEVANPFWIVSAAVPIIVISYSFTRERNKLSKAVNSPYMLDYVRLSSVRAKAHRKRIFIQLFWVVFFIIGMLVPLLAVLYKYS